MPVDTEPVSGSTVSKNGEMPQTGSNSIIARPEINIGIGSVTQRNRPDKSSTIDIFPVSDSPCGVGSKEPITTIAMATAIIAMRFPIGFSETR